MQMETQNLGIKLTTTEISAMNQILPDLMEFYTFDEPFKDQVLIGGGKKGLYEQELDRNNFIAHFRQLSKRILETQQRKSVAVGENKKDNSYHHALRTAKIVQDFIGINDPIIISLALTHDLSSEKHRLDNTSLIDLIQVNGRWENDEHYRLGVELQAFELLEKIGEGVRSEDTTNPYQFTIVKPELIMNFVEEYGFGSLIVKAAEMIDNMRNPLPECYTNPDSWRAMHHDALEAMYLYIPAMEMLGQQKIVGELKTLACRYLDLKDGQDFLHVTENLKKFRPGRDKDLNLGRQFTAGLISKLQSHGFSLGKLEDFRLHQNMAYANSSGNMAEYWSYMFSRLSNDADKLYIYGREKSPGSGFIKAMSYLDKSRPGWRSLNDRIRRELITNYLIGLPDIQAFSIFSPNSKIYQITNEVLLGVERSGVNQYRNPRDHNEGNLEQKVNEHLGYSALHYVYRSHEMTRAVEVHVRNLGAQLIEHTIAAHSVYKASQWYPEMDTFKFAQHAHFFRSYYGTEFNNLKSGGSYLSAVTSVPNYQTIIRYINS